jgi:hypothetical protein
VICLFASIAVVLVFAGVLWAAFDAGYDHGWIDHSVGRTDYRR